MKFPGDEELILHYYGESEDRAAIDRLIETSPEIGERFQQIRRILDSVAEPEIPLRSNDYGARVWTSIESEINREPWWKSWLQPGTVRRWSLIGAAAMLLVVAFVAGRFSNQHLPPQTVTILDSAGAAERDRALFIAVANHLERSEMLLLELINVNGAEVVNVAAERLLASELKSESQLYRQAARNSGELGVADLLESLEMLLVELANGPEDVQSGDLGALRQRLDDGDLLFRVRVVGSRLREHIQKSNQIEIDGVSVVDV